MDFLNWKKGIVFVNDDGETCTVEIGHSVKLVCGQSSLFVYKDTHQKTVVGTFAVKDIDDTVITLSQLDMEFELVLNRDADIHEEFTFHPEVIEIVSQPYHTMHTIIVDRTTFIVRATVEYPDEAREMPF